MEYDIEIISKGRVVRGVEGDFPDDATAINIVHFYIGFYEADAARLYRGEHTNPRDPSTFITEISSPLTPAERKLFYG
jgi:hypothetical protein